MKLNIKITTNDPKNEIIGYKSLARFNPIGWWQVTTEGDCEGRSTRMVGVFYGHLAEIAFAKRKESGYKLHFSPVSGREAPKKVPTYEVVREAKDKVIRVHIGLDYKMTEGCKPMPEGVAAWLDADGVVVTPSNYYDSVLLAMKVA